MEVTVLAVGGVGVVIGLVAGLLVLLLFRRRGRRRAQRGDPSVASRRSEWITPPVPEARAAPVPPPPKSGHGLIGLEDLPPPRRRRLPPSWVSLGLAALVVTVAAVWNAGFLSALLSGGAPAEPSSWEFMGTDAPGGVGLSSGETARETVEDTAEPIVAEDPETGVRLIAWSGNDQTGLPGRPLGRALAVLVRDAADRPMPGVEVLFSVARGGGRLEPGGVVTSDLGLAAVTWWLGADPDSLRVRVYLADSPALRVEFEAGFQDDAVIPQVAVADSDPELDPDPEPAADPAPQDRATEPVAPTPAETAAREPPPPVATRGASDPTPTGPPAPVSAGARSRSAFAAGGVHTCRLVGAEIVCVGGDQGEASGAGRPVAGAPALRAVRAGVFHSCGLTSTGTVYCWPASASGPATAAAPRAEIALPGGATAVDVAAGSEHSCALTSAGAVYCWGSNTHGQLGNGGTTGARSPVRVGDLPPAVQLVTGWLHTCALTAEGRAYCWGANSAGQVGNGGTGDRTRATAVEQSVGFTLITAGSAHSCGLTAAGEAWCWGSNEHGQLGTGPGARETRPRRTATDRRFSTLSAGGVHTCGLAGNGEASCWGRNTFGQLGDGTTRDSRLPARVVGGHRLVALEAGGAHTCGQAAGGGVYCWGNNMQGQVGDGTRENRSSPVLLMQEGA